MRADCDWPRREIGPSPTPEVYLIAAQNGRGLGLVISEQLTTALIVIQCTADHPLHPLVGGEVAKVQGCSFISRGPPRLVPCEPQVVVNVMSVSGTQ